MAGDQNYGGIAMQFEGVDNGLSKVIKQLSEGLNGLHGSAKKTNSFISGTNDYFRDLLATLSTQKIGVTSESFNQLSGAIQQMMEMPFKEKIGNFTSDLESLAEAGFISKDALYELSSSVSNLKPSIDTSGLDDFSNFMKENNSSSAIKGIEKSNNLLKEKNKYLDKYKDVLKYKDEIKDMMNAHPDFMPKKEYNKTIKELDNLEKKFQKLATNGPGKFTTAVKTSTIKTISMMSSVGSAVKGLLKSLMDGMPSIAQAMIGTGKVGELAKTLDTLSAQMSIVIDPSQVKAFNGGIQDMIRNFGVSGDEARIVATEMNQFGVSVDKSIKMMPLMGKLIGVMGMDAAQVANMFGQTSSRLAIMPDKMNELVAEVYSLGKAQGFVNFLEDLPEVVSTVTDSFNKLGIMNARTAKTAIQSTMALSAVYRKMGFDQKSAIAAANKVQEATANMARDVKRMQVGLDPENFDQMIEVAAEISRVTGKSANESFAQIMDGAKDTNKFQQQLVNDAQKLNDQDRLRFAETMRKSFGDAVGNAIQNIDMGKVSKDAAKITKGVVSGDKAVSEMDAAMKKQRDTFAAQEKVLASNKELVDAMGQLMAKQGIMSSWVAQTKELISLQESIAKQDIFGQAKTLAEAMIAGGGAAVAFQTGFDQLGASIAKIGTDIDQISKASESVGILGSAMSSLGSILGSLLSGILVPIAKSIWNYMGGLKAIGPWFAKIGTSLKGVFTEFIASAASKIGPVFSGIGNFLGSMGTKLGSIVEGLMSFLGTAGRFVANLLGPVAKVVAAFQVGYMIGNALQDMMKAFAPNVWNSVIKFLDGVVNSIADMFGQSSTLMTILDKITSSFDYVVEKIQKAIGMLPSWAGGDEVEPKRFPEQFVRPDAGQPQINTDSILKKQSPIMMMAPPANPQKPPMPASANSYQPAAPSGSDLVVSSPLMNQPEAPRLSGISNFKPTLKQKDKGNTLDDVVTALIDLRDLMKSGFGDMKQDVNVVLQGDAKKFFTAYSHEGKNAMGLAGHGNAVTGSGGRS